MGKGARYGLAKTASGFATWGLVHIAHREAGNMPGKIALRISPQVIAEAAGEKLRNGSIAVVGTNGKTTVTNLIADAVEASGQSVICNRSGANLASGVATALLRAKGTYDWGIFESDELWLAKTLPQLKSRYVVLLNLFRDQLDRCGEIDRIQDSIVHALESSPKTALIYNADDPLCAMIAERAAAIPARKGVVDVAFGVAENMGLQQNIVSDSTMCQRCSHMLKYEYRQYGQLGPYECPNCGFKRPPLQFAARNVKFGAGDISFDIDYSANGSNGSNDSNDANDAGSEGHTHIQANLSGSYMVYNLLAVFTAAHLLGCSIDDIQRAVDVFDPKNGRLQEYLIGGHHVLLNLAKNPTGFNQNLRIIAQRLQEEQGRAVAAFFINDKEADGHDISWIWDIDFEELAGKPNLEVLAGGIRKNDLQVRLKYAGIKAQLVDSATEALRVADDRGSDIPVYIITNYTALAPVHHELDKAASESAEEQVAEYEIEHEQEHGHHHHHQGHHPHHHAARDTAAAGAVSSDAGATAQAEPLPLDDGPGGPVVIAHLFPDLLNLYGDGGNVRILKQRLQWRGIPVEVRPVTYGETIDLSQVDMVFMGGGPDGEQNLAAEELHKMRDQLAAFVAEDAPVLAICGGYQILGDTWLLGEEEVPGLGIVDAATRRPGTSGDRLIDNIALRSDLATRPVIGYENHASRTYLADGEKAFGTVVSHTGKGNNEETAADGVIHKNVIGTYLHGPLLSKNPEVADWLLARTLERYAARTGAQATPELTPLDDSEEVAANEFMAAKIIKH